MPKNPTEQSKQRALEHLERVQDAAEKARRDMREFSEAVLSISTRVLEEGKYPPEKMFADAVATTLHGFAIWASWWMPSAPTPPKSA